MQLPPEAVRKRAGSQTSQYAPVEQDVQPGMGVLQSVHVPELS